MPVWHASVALQPVTPLWAWSPRAREWALEELRRLVRGVGRGDDIIEEGEVAIHLRRLVSEEEFRVVGPAKDVRPKR